MDGEEDKNVSPGVGRHQTPITTETEQRMLCKMDGEEHDSVSGVGSLQLLSTIGFEGDQTLNFVFISLRCLSVYFLFFVSGSVPGGLVAHPDGKHIIYPLGCTLIVKDLSSQKQTFLSGHSNNISCLACSSSGVYLASGHISTANIF